MSRISTSTSTTEPAGGQPDPYLVSLGQRVRDMRAVRGMSRKVLSRVSGVSERYIAQLESGQGNVSILLLRRVSQAIGVRLEDLIAEPGTQHSDWLVMRDLMNAASPERIAEACAILAGTASEKPDVHLTMPRVALIGLRGAGKTTLGRLAAERLNWPFVELNKEIERANALSVGEIFALYGQDGYRRFEQSCLSKLRERSGPMILATGGGIVAEPLTFSLLLSSFFTIWLQASPEEHMERVRAQGDIRPMADDGAAMDELRAILKSREPLYAQASTSLDTSGVPIEEAGAALIGLIKQKMGARLEAAS